MPTRARRLQEQKKNKIRLWVLIGTVAMAVAQFIFPGSEGTLIAALVIVFIVSIPLARNGYIYAARWRVWAPILVGHIVVLSAIGWLRWPAIRASPTTITFQGMQQETYDFTLRNATDSDAYLVRVPFLVPNGLDGRIEPHVAKDEMDAALPLEEYGYCYSNNGKEYLVVEIPTLLSHEAKRFSLVYIGGRRATAKVGAITSTNEQPPHSPSMQVGGIIGDYRVCHIHGRIK